MLENLTIDTNTTSAARTPTKHTISAAEHAIKHAVEHIAKHAAEHAALHTSTKNITSVAKTPTKNLPSVARKLLNISMIGAAPFNYLVQKLRRDLKI